MVLHFTPFLKNAIIHAEVLGVTDKQIAIFSQVNDIEAQQQREDFGNKLMSQIAAKGDKIIRQRVVIGRQLNRLSTIEEVKERYISYKRLNGLSAHTIKNARDFFVLLYRFIAVLTIEAEDLHNVPSGELLAQISTTPICVLEADYFEELYREYLEYLGQSQTTIHENMMRFGTFYRYCSDELKIVPHKTIKIKNVETPIKALYTNEQLNVLLEKPKDYKTNHTAHRNWVIIQYAYNTGNRRTSICNIKMKDLAEMEDGFIIINVVKNKKPQRIVVPQRLVKIIKEYINIWRYDATPDDFLFINQYGDEITPSGLSHIIMDHNRRLLGEDAPTSIHLFRHQYAAEYIRDEGNMFDLQKQLGHSTLKMVKHYAEHYANPNVDNIASHAPINRREQTGVREKIKPNK